VCGVCEEMTAKRKKRKPTRPPGGMTVA